MIRGFRPWVTANRVLGSETPRQAYRDEAQLVLAFAGLVALVCGISLVGGAAIARPLFVLAAVGMAEVARRRSPWLFVSTTMWFWLFTAFVRRVVEWHGGFQSADFILITPDLTILLVVQQLATMPGFFRRPGIGYAGALMACVACGLFVSFYRGDILPGLFSATDWMIPLFYLFHFICNSERIDEAEAHFAAFLTFSTPIVVCYAISQYFNMPDWDGQWEKYAGMDAFGPHVFGTLSSPGSLAIWVGMTLIFLGYFRNAVLIALAPFTIFVLALTQVRALYGATLIAVLAGVVMGRGRFGQLAAIIIVGGVVASVTVATFLPETAAEITKRAMTVQDLRSDDSAQVRAMIWRAAPAQISANPLGVGIGGQGRGQAQNNVEGSTINIDFGPLSVYLGLGWIPGTLYIFTMLLLAVRSFGTGRRCGSAVGATMAAAAICPLGTFLFVNVIGFSAVCLWLCMGYVLALEARRLGPQRELGAQNLEFAIGRGR